MRHRIETATDIAMIGAWDAGRNDSEFDNVWGKKLTEGLERDAIEGYLFFIYTGADGGGPVDVYVDSEPPKNIQQHCRAVKKNFLISIPTGQLVVGGVEDYRSKTMRAVNKQSIVSVPSGDYSLRCWTGKHHQGIVAPSAKELENVVGVNDYRFYQRFQMGSIVAYFVLPVLFVVIGFSLGWIVAGVATLIIGTAAALILKQFAKSNDRFRRVSIAVNDAWQNARQQQPPTFIFELHRLESRIGIKGGSFRL